MSGMSHQPLRNPPNGTGKIPMADRGSNLQERRCYDT